jgi:hypothetical protein
LKSEGIQVTYNAAKEELIAKTNGKVTMQYGASKVGGRWTFKAIRYAGPAVVAITILIAAEEANARGATTGEIAMEAARAAADGLCYTDIAEGGFQLVVIGPGGELMNHLMGGQGPALKQRQILGAMNDGTAGGRGLRDATLKQIIKEKSRTFQDMIDDMEQKRAEESSNSEPWYEFW